MGTLDFLRALLAVLLAASVALLPACSKAGEASSSVGSDQQGSAAEDAGSTEAVEVAGPVYTRTEWDSDAYPDYWREVGPAQVDAEMPEVGTIVYSELDELGRAGRAVAYIDYDLMRAGQESERPDMRSLKPSGWGHNQEVYIPMPDGSTYHGALFNRSHLIAKSLGGEAIIENLVTGTRTQNVGDNSGTDGGMAYPEYLAREWLYDHKDGTVYYSATPVYVGDDLVCRSVIVDILSSDGVLDLEIEVYNTALGFTIDYADGSWDYAL